MPGETVTVLVTAAECGVITVETELEDGVLILDCFSHPICNAAPIETKAIKSNLPCAKCSAQPDAGTRLHIAQINHVQATSGSISVAFWCQDGCESD